MIEVPLRIKSKLYRKFGLAHKVWRVSQGLTANFMRLMEVQASIRTESYQLKLNCAIRFPNSLTLNTRYLIIKTMYYIFKKLDLKMVKTFRQETISVYSAHI